MSTGRKQQGGGKAARATGVRHVVAELVGLYGVVLVVVGMFDRAADLWTGVVLVLVAAGLALRSRRRAVLVEQRGDAAG